MGLTDMFFTDASTADNARAISALIRSNIRKSRRRSKDIKELYERVSALESDLDFLALITMSLFAALHEAGVVTPENVLKKIGTIDQADGVQDGKLTPEALRAALGFTA